MKKQWFQMFYIMLCNAMESIDTNLHPKVKESIDNYQSKLNDIPESHPANIPIEHSIELSDVTPVYDPPRTIAYSQPEQISKAIDELQAKDFVEPSRSQYSSPVVPVVKRNGDVRVCCDYRKLNAKTIARQFPLPCVDELIDNMRNLSIYSVINLKSGYFQISLKEEDREKTPFVLPWGKYQWKCMPEGLLGAPFTFAENISHIFSDMTLFVSAYFDDIAIFSTTEEKHYMHVQKVLD